MGTSELLPAHLWGLDPLFRSYAKLYIKDVIALQEVGGHQGVYKFHSHPVVRVDIQGVIVKVDERDSFFVYALDDDTGVINCTHWKSTEKQELPQSLNDLLADNLSVLLKEIYQQKNSKHCGHKLGDLINIGGKVRRFRDQMEVIASNCVCLNDPNKETETMMLLPIVYKRCYNQPVTIPEAEDLTNPGDSNIFPSCELEAAILDCISQQETFCKNDLTTERIKSLLNKSQQVETLLNNILLSLEMEGSIFRKTVVAGSPMFCVTRQCSALKESIIRIIRQYIQEHNDEGGCQENYIYDQLMKILQFRNIEKAVLCCCLEHMESNSMIISIAEKTYIVFDD